MHQKCFAFEPTADQIARENKDMEKKALTMFPRTDASISFPQESRSDFCAMILLRQKIATAAKKSLQGFRL